MLGPNPFSLDPGSYTHMACITFQSSIASLMPRERLSVQPVYNDAGPLDVSARLPGLGRITGYFLESRPPT